MISHGPLSTRDVVAQSVELLIELMGRTPESSATARTVRLAVRDLDSTATVHVLSTTIALLMDVVPSAGRMSRDEFRAWATQLRFISIAVTASAEESHGGE